MLALLAIVTLAPLLYLPGYLIAHALLGAAQWDSPEAIALIRYYLDAGKGGEEVQVLPTSG